MNNQIKRVEQYKNSVIDVIKKSSISVSDYETYLIPLMSSYENLIELHKIEIEKLKLEVKDV